MDVPEIEIRQPASPFELLHHERYTADEVAQLLGINVHTIRHAAFAGELPAQIVGHHMLSLRRQDVVTWFMNQCQQDQIRH